MNREEFLVQFRETLDGKVSEQVIADNVDYYRSYINGQMTAGKSESEVLGMLGDPRLLAKTIEESSKFASGRGSDRNGYTGGYGDYSSFQGGNNEYTKSNDEKRIKFPGRLIAGIVFVVFMLVIMVVFRVFVFFAPVIIVFALAGFLYRAVKEWIHK